MLGHCEGLLGVTFSVYVKDSIISSHYTAALWAAGATETMVPGIAAGNFCWGFVRRKLDV